MPLSLPCLSSASTRHGGIPGKFNKERGKQNYLLVSFQDNEAYCSLTDWDATDSCPSMCHSSYSDDWLQECCTRTSFRELPIVWQKMFRDYVETDY